eukprot:TRINITY_DN58372_c0_g1_i1.p1 TRINITY_DN58372_c0_g1~~TRINITY_DN58372_c0_g1_i1.p1  ORF type:complete len:402 (-),score=41.30 TRINITY_DN58372_c0_g1_i1:34-1239(-)
MAPVGMDISVPRPPVIPRTHGQNLTANPLLVRPKRCSMPMSSAGTYQIGKRWSADPVASAFRKCRFYAVDFFHSSVGLPWRKLFPSVILSYIGSWVIYGTIGKLLFGEKCVTSYEADETVWWDWYFWACETMSTVGYGALRPACKTSMIFVGVMVIHGCFLDAIVLGFIFTKLASPAKRGQTIMVSKSLCGAFLSGTTSATNNGHLLSHKHEGTPLALSVRIVNVRNHPVLHTAAAFYLVDSRPVSQGEPPLFHALEFRTTTPLTFLEFPCTLTAIVPPGCPAYDAAVNTAHSMMGVFDGNSATENAEGELSLVLVLDGQDAASGGTFQMRRWWSLAHAHWNCKFKPMLLPVESSLIISTLSESSNDATDQMIVELAWLDHVVSNEQSQAGDCTRTMEKRR